MASFGEEQAYYDEHGYVIFRGLIPESRIDAYLRLYRDVLLPSKDLFLRQTTTKWAAHVYTDFGYIKESVKDPHSYDFPDSRKYGALSKAVRDILCSTDVSAALSATTGSAAHKMTNSMFFDANTATQPHYDAFYLDSIPAGHLLGGWFALEGIAEEAGRFFVIPGSHRDSIALSESEKLSHDLFARNIAVYADKNSGRIRTPALNKGDVLFWNSMLVHGSTATKDNALSRKSLTAHYLPAELAFGTQFSQTAAKLSYTEHDGMQYQVLPLSSPPRAQQEIARQFAKTIRDRYPAIFQAGRQAYRLIRPAAK